MKFEERSLHLVNEHRRALPNAAKGETEEVINEDNSLRARRVKFEERSLHLVNEHRRALPNAAIGEIDRLWKDSG